MAGFLWKYNLSGGRPLIYEFLSADTETLTVGDMLNVQTGEVDLAASNDNLMLGPLVGASDPDDNIAGAAGTIAAVDSTTQIRTIVNRDAVLGDDSDAAARLAGASLDIAGATGAQGVAAAANADFYVVKPSAAVEDTLVIVAFGEHFLDP